LDFFTTHPSPFPINIDGVAYKIPRFLMPAMKAWAAELIERQRNAASAEFATPDEKARFAQYWPEPAFDIGDLYRRVTTPEGTAYVVNAQLKEAKVPDEVRERVVTYGDPSMLRQLALELTYAQQTEAKLGIDAEAEKADPKSTAPSESNDSAGIGPQTAPTSTPATAA
jgi:hypothetical protein